MFVRQLISSIIMEKMDPEMAKASLAILQSIDTSSSQWRKTKKGSIQTDELKNVQYILNDLGYNVGKADGWFGRKTARGVMNFQKDNDLTVDGDPGKNTINKMIQIVGDIYFGTTPQEGTPDDPKEVNRLLLGQLKDYIFKFTPEKYEELKDTHQVVFVRFRKETLYLAPIVPFVDGTPPGNPDGPVVDGSGMPMPEKSKNKDDDITSIAKDALDSLDNESLEEKQVWAKSGQKVVRKYRCTGGSRKGRVVSQPAQCFKAKDIKRRIALKKTKARLGNRMARKARRTKRVSPVSRRVAQLNKSSR